MKITKRQRATHIVTVRFTDEMYAKLRKCAEESEMPLSEAMRWMLKDWLHENKGFDELGEWKPKKK